MRNGLLGSIAALAAGAGLAFAQSPRLTPAGPVAGPPAMVAPAANEPVPSAAYCPPGEMGSPAVDMVGPGAAQATGREHPCVWIEGENLLWGVKNGPNHWPLIVSGNIPNGAVPGAPGALVIFGNGDYDYGLIDGARARAGMLFPGSSWFGLEAEGLILPRRTLTGAAASGPLGIPVIGEPFINTATGLVSSVNASSPANPGSMSAQASIELWTAEVNAYASLYRGDVLHVSVISGFKHFDLAELLVVDASRTIGSAGQTFLGRPLAIGSAVAWEDRFDTTNRFYGWELGVNYELVYGRWVANLDLHSAIGSMRESVDYGGFSQATTGPAAARVTQQVPGGVLAAISTLGRRTTDNFAWVPELRAELGYRLTRNIRVSMGYTFLYASNTVRPGNQIDTMVNPTIVPLRPEYGLAAPVPVRPLPQVHHSDFWAQGVNWSLNIAF
ncbi:MAG: BBP7 family outer membrane beta-barrel protein [Gemmataceae bacterium]